MKIGELVISGMLSAQIITDTILPRGFKAEKVVGGLGHLITNDAGDAVVGLCRRVGNNILKVFVFPQAAESESFVLGFVEKHQDFTFREAE